MYTAYADPARSVRIVKPPRADEATSGRDVTTVAKLHTVLGISFYPDGGVGQVVVLVLGSMGFAAQHVDLIVVSLQGNGVYKVAVAAELTKTVEVEVGAMTEGPMSIAQRFRHE